jgi:hypothetical protein
MHNIPLLTSNNAQKPTRDFQKCKKSNEELPIMQKIPQGTSKNPMKNFKNAQHPVSFFQKCKKSHE